MAGWLHSIGFLDSDWSLLGSGLSGASGAVGGAGVANTPPHEHSLTHTHTFSFEN